MRFFQGRVGLAADGIVGPATGEPWVSGDPQGPGAEHLEHCGGVVRRDQASAVDVEEVPRRPSGGRLTRGRGLRMPLTVTVHVDNAKGFADPRLHVWYVGSTQTEDLVPIGEDGFGPVFEVRPIRSSFGFTLHDGATGGTVGGRRSLLPPAGAAGRRPRQGLDADPISVHLPRGTGGLRRRERGGVPRPPVRDEGASVRGRTCPTAGPLEAGSHPAHRRQGARGLPPPDRRGGASHRGLQRLAASLVRAARPCPVCTVDPHPGYAGTSWIWLAVTDRLPVGGSTGSW